MKSNLVFLVQSWGDSHEMNRLLHYNQKFSNIKILAFKRSKNNFDFGLKDYKLLGKIENGSYLLRFFKYLNALIILVKMVRKENNLYYLQGSDNLILFNVACLIAFRKQNFIYQISDIREILTSNRIKHKLIKYLDAKFVNKSSMIVVTSYSFIEDFYKKIIFNKSIKIEVIENKIHQYYIKPTNIYNIRNLKTDSNNTERIVIGYFGFIRCERSLQTLIKLVETKNYSVIIRGTFLENLKQYINIISKTDNIEFLGEFVSPFHLAEMYDEIDLSWVCYPFSSEKEGNFKWARTNRFYEAGYFKKPMITQSGTRDSEESLKLGVGIEIDLSDIDSSIKVIKAFSKSRVIKLKNNFEDIQDKAFVITDDYNNVDKYIKNNLNYE